ncbi:conjugal transfer protein TrbC, partial [Legionella pneumophila]
MNQAVNINYRSIWMMGGIVLFLLFITVPACA